ncbi:unnamed protein product, partial [marine sediment metagenome]
PERELKGKKGKEKKGKRVRWKTKVISGRVSLQTYQAVLDIVELGIYVDVTDYLRDLIRKDLVARGVTLEKQIT